MENQELTPVQPTPKRSRFGMVGGLVLIIVGLLILVENYFPQVSKLYGPIILIVIGLALIIPNLRK